MFSKRHFPKCKIIISSLLILSMLSSYVFGLAGCVYAAPNKNLTQTILTEGGAGKNTTNNNPKPTTRDLAIFATLAYANLENIKGYSQDKDPMNKLTFKSSKMVTDAQLKNLKTNTTIAGVLTVDGNETMSTYDFWFNGLASTNEVKDWNIMNYTKCKSKLGSFEAGEFTAMTFKKNNIIVIAYRGTDMHDFMEWMQDIVGYGLNGATGQEKLAQEYARKVAKQYKDCDIYITGHSLGGYLSQIGAAAIVNQNYKVKAVSYFDGMGLEFASNLAKNIKLLKKLATALGSDKNFKQLSDAVLSDMQKIQIDAKAALKKFIKGGGEIVSNYTKGDWVSALGTHLGKTNSYNLYDPSRIQSNTWGVLTSADGRNIATTFVDLLSVACNMNFSKYIEEYKATGLVAYMLMTHKMDTILGVTQTNNTNLEIDVDGFPDSLAVGKTKTIKVKITMRNIELKDPNSITVNSFLSSNEKAIKITGVTQSKKAKKAGSTITYTYDVTLKGGMLSGLPTNISLKANALKIKGNSNQVINDIVKKDIILDSTEIGLQSLFFLNPIDPFGIVLN